MIPTHGGGVPSPHWVGARPLPPTGHEKKWKLERVTGGTRSQVNGK
jgi:hypothetical protein